MDSVKDALHPIVASAYTAKICDVLVGLAAKKRMYAEEMHRKRKYF